MFADDSPLCWAEDGGFKCSDRSVRATFCNQDGQQIRRCGDWLHSSVSFLFLRRSLWVSNFTQNRSFFFSSEITNSTWLTVLSALFSCFILTCSCNNLGIEHFNTICDEVDFQKSEFWFWSLRNRISLRDWSQNADILRVTIFQMLCTFCLLPFRHCSAAFQL